MWKFVRSGVDGNCNLFGKNIFNYEWINTKQKIRVLDPIYNQPHILTIYKADIGSDVVTFAAGEFSNNVYGFYVDEKVYSSMV